MSPTRLPIPSERQSRPRDKSRTAGVPARRHTASGHQPAADNLQSDPAATPTSSLPPVDSDEREGGVVPGLDIPPPLSATGILAAAHASPTPSRAAATSAALFERAGEQRPDALVANDRMPGQAVLTAGEVAETFSITLRTLGNWETAGILIPQRIRGRRYFSIAEVETLIRQGHRRYDRKSYFTDGYIVQMGTDDTQFGDLNATRSHKFP